MQTQEKLEDPLKPSAPPLPLYTSTITVEPTPKRKSKKCLKKICCILLIIKVLIAIILFLALHVFKKRAVEVTATSTTVENLSFSITPVTLILVMGVTIGIKNPNYAGFEYQRTNTMIYYHGIEAGISPMPAGGVKARSSKDIQSTVYMNATTMISSQYLLPEMIAGKLPLSTSTSMVGKVVLFNNIKIHATVHTSCDVIVNLHSSTTAANCMGNVKMS